MYEFNGISMYIAKKKRKENIAEYILYIWQLEDLFRALRFDNNLIYSQLVAPQTTLDDEQKEQTLFWYIDLINLLKSEGKAESGHIEHTLHLIDDLNDLHLQLLKLPSGQDYATRYATVAPEIAKLRAQLGGKTISDIELCFRALYSVVLLRLKNDDNDNQHTTDVIEVISPLVAHLVSIYHGVEKGTFNLFENQK